MTVWFKYLSAVPAKWRRRSRIERLLLLEAFTFLGIARLLVLTIPFKWLAFSLGKHMKESSKEICASDLNLARMIGQAVRAAAGNTPWKSVCLPQAIAAKWMISRRKITGTVYLGVMKDKNKMEKLAAHAWIRCGNIILTGAEGHRQYIVVSTFS